MNPPVNQPHTLLQLQRNSVVFRDSLIALQQQLQAAAHQNNQLHQQLQKKEQQNIELCQQLRLLKSCTHETQLRVQTILRQNSGITNKLNGLSAELQNQSKINCALQQQNVLLSKNNQNHQKRITHLFHDSERISIQGQRSLNALAELTAQLQKERAFGKQRERVLVAAQNSLRACQTKILNLQQSAQRETAILGAQIDRAKMIITSLKKQNSRLSIDHDSLLNDRELLKGQNCKLKNQLTMVYQDKGLAGDVLQSQANEISQLKQSNQELKHRLCKMSGQKQSGQQKCQQLQYEIIRLRGQLGRFQRQTFAFISLQDKIRQLEGLSDVRKQQNQLAFRELSQTLDSLRKQNLMLLQNLQNESFKVRTLQVGRNQLLEDLKVLRQQNSRLAKEGIQLSSKITDLEKELIAGQFSVKNQIYSMQEGAVHDITLLLRDKQKLTKELSHLKQKINSGKGCFSAQNQLDFQYNRLRQQYQGLIQNFQSQKGRLMCVHKGEMSKLRADFQKELSLSGRSNQQLNFRLQNQLANLTKILSNKDQVISKLQDSLRKCECQKNNLEERLRKTEEDQQAWQRQFEDWRTHVQMINSVRSSV